MYKTILLLCVVLFSSVTYCLADDNQQVITLKDGSQIKGVLSGVTNGVYTVNTPIIGEVKINAADVASITNGNTTTAIAATMPAPAAPTAPSGSTTDQQIASAQQRLMSDPQSMAIIQKMAQDPQMVQALQDPELVQAVTHHDLAAVQNNPNIQKIMQDPQMRALIEKLAAEQQQPQGSGSSSP